MEYYAKYPLKINGIRLHVRRFPLEMTESRGKWIGAASYLHETAEWSLEESICQISTDIEY